ncbi:MAG TPA: hypothetical protein DCK83_07195 [Gallionellaceae bacterium]|nr:hypothetical protein [Gallionellaceae bacterium]
MSQVWTIPEIDPAVTSPAVDIQKMLDGLNALKTVFSGAALPTTNLVGGMLALETTNNLYWRRDAANTKWMIYASADAVSVVAKAAAYTVLLGDHGKTFSCAGTFALDFTAAATLTDGWWCNVRNDGAGNITLDPNLAELIDGAATVVLLPGQSCLVKCDGAGLITVGKPSSEFAAGTRMTFQQTTAPTGWTKDTTAALNDSIMRIVTGAVVGGGSTAFSTFNGQTATAAYTLTTSNIPAHAHGVTDAGHNHSQNSHAHTTVAGASVQVDLSSGGGTTYSVPLYSAGSGTSGTTATNNSAATGISTNNAGGGASHSHGITTAIKYNDFIIASKN